MKIFILFACLLSACATVQLTQAELIEQERVLIEATNPNNINNIIGVAAWDI